MAKKLTLSDQVANRAQKRYPDYEIEIDAPGQESETIVFRNLIRLTKEERRTHSNAAVDLQNEIKEALEKAKAAEEDGDDADPALIEELEALDGTDLYVRMLKRQLVVLAEDGEKAQTILDGLDDEYIAALHSIVTDGLDAAGE